VDQAKQESTTPTMAPKKTKKEQAAHRKVASQKKLAAQQSKVMDPKVSLHDGDVNNDSTSGIEEAAEASVQTTDGEEGLIQSNKDSTKISTSY
jgi:phage antirepressor YoqD-like protein